MGGTPIDGGEPQWVGEDPNGWGGTPMDGESHRVWGGPNGKDGRTQWMGTPWMDGGGGGGKHGRDGNPHWERAPMGWTAPNRDPIDGETSGESGDPMKGGDPMQGSPMEWWRRGEVEGMGPPHGWAAPKGGAAPQMKDHVGRGGPWMAQPQNGRENSTEGPQEGKAAPWEGMGDPNG